MSSLFQITGFKAFEDQQVRIDKLTVFAGSNSVGKSTIIQALLLLRTAYEETLRQGIEAADINIPLNGPFLLELGNTDEVIRRGRRVEASNITFQLTFNNELVSNVILWADRAGGNRHVLNLRHKDFRSPGKGILSDKFYYLCAERVGPRLKSEFNNIQFPHAGYKGENTFQVLTGDNFDVSAPKTFKNTEPFLFYAQVRMWLNYIIPGASFDNASSIGKSTIIEATINESLPTNVGFGISYTLPIIVNGLVAKNDSWFIVENPEAHLHPSGQSRIGRFLAQIAHSGVTVIIETHSEHVINGMRLAMLEDSNLSPDDAVINFLSKNEEGKTVVKEIRFDSEAELDQYPPGFIDQEQRDTAEMIRKIKKAQSNERKSAS